MLVVELRMYIYNVSLLDDVIIRQTVVLITICTWWCVVYYNRGNRNFRDIHNTHNIV